MGFTEHEQRMSVFPGSLEVTPQDMNVEKDADATSDHNLLVANIKLKHKKPRKYGTEDKTN